MVKQCVGIGGAVVEIDQPEVSQFGRPVKDDRRGDLIKEIAICRAEAASCQGLGRDALRDGDASAAAEFFLQGSRWLRNACRHCEELVRV